MALAIFFCLFLGIAPLLGQDLTSTTTSTSSSSTSPSNPAPSDPLPPLPATDTSCTYLYSLLAKDEAIHFLENLIKPIALEKFLVDILQHQPAVARRSNPQYYGPLFHVDDITTILKNGRKQENPKKKIKYLEEWKLVKRTMRDGEWWTGVYNPNSTITVQEAKDAFGKGGFTLIIKEMQSLWNSIHHVAWLVEAALGWRVNVNLYMSPIGSQGFEAHYDWMDGFILQVYGRKNWTIYDPPMAVYPRPDHVRRPSPEFLRLAKQEKDPDSNISFTNVPPQEFVLSTGDLVYVPRGVVHEATATRPATGAEEDLSLHLTFGIETATHYSVENVITAFQSNVVAFTLQNDLDSSSVYIPATEGVVEDLLHLILSGVSSYGGPLLRSAVGVTVMLIDIPQLNPLKLLPFAVREFFRSLHLPTILKFLIQRGFVKLMLKDSTGEALMLYPGLDATQSMYQSGDFTCRYLNPFFSKSFLSSDRMITMDISHHFRDNWKDLLSDSASLLNSTTSTPDRSYYNRTKVVHLLDELGNWTNAENQVAEILVKVFESKANVLPSGDQEEDEIFCIAWKRMMISVREEKSTRKKRQVEALKAAGQQLKEKQPISSTQQEPSEEQTQQQEASHRHIEL